MGKKLPCDRKVHTFFIFGQFGAISFTCTFLVGIITHNSAIKWKPMQDKVQVKSLKLVIGKRPKFTSENQTKREVPSYRHSWGSKARSFKHVHCGLKPLLISLGDQKRLKSHPDWNHRKTPNLEHSFPEQNLTVAEAYQQGMMMKTRLTTFPTLKRFDNLLATFWWNQSFKERRSHSSEKSQRRFFATF